MTSEPVPPPRIPPADQLTGIPRNRKASPRSGRSAASSRIAVDPGDAATIASAAAGVIATIVGAYFGLKIGSDQTKTASENQKVEAAKAQVFAAHLPPDEAKDILGLANEAAKKVLGK